MKKTLIHFFEDCAGKFNRNIFLKENIGHGYQGMSYGEVRERVYRLAAGLMAAGLNRGDRVALLSEPRNDWVVCELAILFCGAVNVPLAVRMNEPGEIRFRITHSGASMIIVSAGQAKKIEEIQRDLPEVRTVVVIDEPATGLPATWIPMSRVMKQGEDFLLKSPKLFLERKSSVMPGDYANISYTSGTTSDPKGIILTHENFVTNVEQAYSLMDIAPDYTTLLILPWDHAFAHTAGIYCFMGKGASVASVQAGKTTMETLKNIPGNIREIRPHLLYSVPAIASNFRKNIEKSIEAKGPAVMGLFRTGLRISILFNGLGIDRGRGWKVLLRPLVAIFDRLIFKKIRQGFGGRLEYFIGGGALLDIELQKFFYAIGIPMLQGYGLTEAAPLISANAFHRHRLGSSGLPVQNMELRICDDQGKSLPPGGKGEIVIRGGNVMAGYWKNPQATAETLRDGWLHTGDMGYLDRDGFLYVLGRFKSLLIAGDGEKYSPEGMEEMMMSQSPFIAQCMLYNNQDPYTIVLVFPDRERLLRYLKERHIDPKAPEAIRAALEKVEHEFLEYRTGHRYGDLFPQRWLPAAIGILPEGFTEENHLLNFQMKIVRGRVVEKYRDRIDHLYTPAGKIVDNPFNQAAIGHLLGTKL